MKVDLSQVRRVVKLRPYNEDTDKNFILSTYLKSVYSGARCFQGVSEREFNDRLMDVFRKKVETCKCVVACNAEDEAQIFGYLLYTPTTVVQWLYVKKDFRKLKIATLLFTDVFGDHERYEISYPFETYMTQKLKQNFQHIIKFKHNILLW